MCKWILLVLLMACGTALAAEWVSIGKTADGKTEDSVDVSSLRVTGSIRRAWFKAIFAPQTIQEKAGPDANKWWREEVRPHIAPGARAVLEMHRQRGDRLVLLTSSSRYASEMAREEFGLDHLLFQGYEVRDGRFTGAPMRPLCYGQGKVAIAEEWAREAGIDLAKSSFYSDSSTDIPMLERVGNPFAVLPDPRLRRVAKRRGWPLLDWREKP